MTTVNSVLSLGIQQAIYKILTLITIKGTIKSLTQTQIKILKIQFQDSQSALT
jgi:hypothetical protein